MKKFEITVDNDIDESDIVEVLQTWHDIKIYRIEGPWYAIDISDIKLRIEESEDV